MPQKVFKNHGASAGASMSHSHSQIIALPVVPPAVSARFEGMKECFERTGKCKLCQIPENDLFINESVHHISIVPFAASFPFEIWIIPRYHSSYFHELDNEKVLSNFLSLPKFIYIIAVVLVNESVTYLICKDIIYFRSPTYLDCESSQKGN